MNLAWALFVLCFSAVLFGSSKQNVPKAADENRKDERELYVRSKAETLEQKLLRVIQLYLEKNKKFHQKVNERLTKLENSPLPLPHKECSGYKWMKDSYRNQKNAVRGSNCDNTLPLEWYRFGGGAGIKMPTSCVPTYRCGTLATGWMNGAHPTVSEGKVTRKVCYHWGSNCCALSNNIEVVNCGSYYVFKLGPSPGCYYAYCGSD